MAIIVFSIGHGIYAAMILTTNLRIADFRTRCREKEHTKTILLSDVKP